MFYTTIPPMEDMPILWDPIRSMPAGEMFADRINMFCPDRYTDLGRLARHRGLAEQSLDPHFC